MRADCTAQKDLLKHGPFVKGTDNFRLESIRDRERSQSHKQCLLVAEAKATPKRASVAQKAINALNKTQTLRMQAPILMVKLNSTDISSFNPDEAVEYWMAHSSRQRRPSFNSEDSETDDEVNACEGFNRLEELFNS